MKSELRWKLLTTAVVVIAFAAVGVYPMAASRYKLPVPTWLAAHQLRLGLDLQGGVHLVLQVQTDDALRLQSETESERLRELMTSGNIPFTRIDLKGPDTFVVEGIPADHEAQFRNAAGELQTDYDRSAGANGTYTFTMKQNVAIQLREEAVAQARETIERRVNELGVTEPRSRSRAPTGTRSWCSCPA